MRFRNEHIRGELQKGLLEEQGQALNGATGSVSPADFDRLSQELTDMLEEMGWSQSGPDKRGVDEDDTGVPAAC